MVLVQNRSHKNEKLLHFPIVVASDTKIHKAQRFYVAVCFENVMLYELS